MALRRLRYSILFSSGDSVPIYKRSNLLAVVNHRELDCLLGSLGDKLLLQHPIIMARHISKKYLAKMERNKDNKKKKTKKYLKNSPAYINLREKAITRKLRFLDKKNKKE
nr:unnamed protein product [Callosobruchus analis]